MSVVLFYVTSFKPNEYIVELGVVSVSYCLLFSSLLSEDQLEVCELVFLSLIYFKAISERLSVESKFNKTL